MAFICSRGCTLIFLSPFTHTLYISLLHLHTPPDSFPDSLASRKALGGWGDLAMFGCCSVHPRYMFDTQIGEASTPFSSHISHFCDQLLFISPFSACFVSHSFKIIIINPLIMWCHFAIAGSDGKRVLKTESFRCACCCCYFFSFFLFSERVYFKEAALPLGWTVLNGWEIYFILNKMHWLHDTGPNHIHSFQWELAPRHTCCTDGLVYVNTEYL